jgi:ketosteroid isomerase-like protein
VPADDLAPLRDSFVATLAAWQEAKSGNDLSALLSFYTDDFQGLKKITRQAWSQQLAADMAKQKGRPLVLKELSLMHWQDEEDTMVVTFGAVPQGERSGSTLRQYWRFAKGQGWKIFFEGNI